MRVANFLTSQKQARHMPCNTRNQKFDSFRWISKWGTMGHPSRDSYDSGRDSFETKRWRSSSPSRTERKRKDTCFERLERMVENLDRRSQEHGSCIHRGDELMIPPLMIQSGEGWYSNRQMDQTIRAIRLIWSSDHEANSKQIKMLINGDMIHGLN